MIADIENDIAGCLDKNPDQTTTQVAAAIGHDHWIVQGEVIRMMLAGRLVQTGHRPAAGRSWPTYRVAAPETANG